MLTEWSCPLQCNQQSPAWCCTEGLDFSLPSAHKCSLVTDFEQFYSRPESHFEISISDLDLLVRKFRCSYLHFVQVVEIPPLSNHLDGAQSAYQYFENVRNFLVAVEEMGLPSFEASDLEQVQSGMIFCLIRHFSLSHALMASLISIAIRSSFQLDDQCRKFCRESFQLTMQTC